MSPTPAGSQFATGAFQALPLARVWFGLVASAKLCSNLRAGHPGGSSGILERHVDPIQRIEAHVNILISRMDLVRTAMM